MRIRRTDEEYRWFLSRAMPLRDKRGKVVKWYGAATDFQDRKRAEELQTELAHTNRVSMLGELAASISHELKQPIAAAMANAQASLPWLNRIGFTVTRTQTPQPNAPSETRLGRATLIASQLRETLLSVPI
jgi:C4-dicarboxylate-specific signal transduction histidine kinase